MAGTNMKQLLNVLYRKDWMVNAKAPFGGPHAVIVAYKGNVDGRKEICMAWLEKLLAKTGDKSSKNLILSHQSSFVALKTGAGMIGKAKQHFKKQQTETVRLILSA